MTLIFISDNHFSISSCSLHISKSNSQMNFCTSHADYRCHTVMCVYPVFTCGLSPPFVQLYMKIRLNKITNISSFTYLFLSKWFTRLGVVHFISYFRQCLAGWFHTTVQEHVGFSHNLLGLFLKTHCLSQLNYSLTMVLDTIRVIESTPPQLDRV